MQLDFLRFGTEAHPTWINVHTIAALTPDTANGGTNIHLTSGNILHIREETPDVSDDLADMLKAMSPGSFKQTK